MAQNFSERNIDLNCEFVVPKSVSLALAEISAIHDVSEKLAKLNSLLQALEEEAKKIYPIRHELPLALSFLNEEMEKVREESLRLKGKEKLPPEMEFFKGNSEGGVGAKRSDDPGEKKNWMLGNPPVVAYDNYNSRKPSNYSPTKPGQAGAMEAEEEAAALKRDALPVPDLSLSPPSASAVVDKTSNPYHSSKMNKNEQRKQRRCWSPELHQRFINALDKLGGAQAATPKQIREIMNVDGLTNDEVKSHLQKYRLHVRRVIVSPPSSTSTWPQPYYHVSNSLAMKVGSGAHSSSPETPLQLGLPVTREASVTVTGRLNAAVEESEEEGSMRGF